MFYDIFLALCQKKGVAPTRVALDVGLSKSTPTTWKKRGLTPQGEALSRIADYFDVSVDYLLSVDKEKAPVQMDKREITYDDFTYAMQNESKELTETDKALLLSMARQLNEARKQKNGESN